MSITSISSTRIAGIACAVPREMRACAEEAAIFGADDVRKISESSGVVSRHVAGPLCTSDLCFAAANRLLDSLTWDRNTIDTLIFVSQTPDYLLPATACSLHGRLGLAKSCAAFDINLGCSGYVYGLWMASNLIAGGGSRRVLLLVGDTITRIASPQDRSVALLFGDAGTATALEFNAEAPPIFYALGTDGGGQEHLRVPAGLFRQPHSETTGLRTERENGNVRSDQDLYMNGGEIFTFTLREIPGLMKSVLEAAGWGVDDADAFVMHQANKFMLNHLGKRMKLPQEKLVLALAEYGNTSSASIPLALAQAPLSESLRTREMRLVLAGFGVGFSWAAAAVQCGPMVLPPVELVDS